MEIVLFFVGFGLVVFVIISKIKGALQLGSVGISMFSAINDNKRIRVEYPNVILTGVLPKKLPVQEIEKITYMRHPLFRIGKAGPILPTFGKEKLNLKNVQFTQAEIAQAFQAGAQTGLLTDNLQNNINKNIDKITEEINASAQNDPVELVSSVTMRVDLRDGKSYNANTIEQTPGEIDELLNSIKGTGIRLLEQNPS